MAQDCLFCKIVAGEIPATVVYEDDDVVAFKDISPQAPAHILVVPRVHIERLSDATEADVNLLGKIVLAGNRVASLAGVAESGYRLIANTGSDGGQEVFHIHFHILGGKKLGRMVQQG